jgi:hypothetical protein
VKVSFGAKVIMDTANGAYVWIDGDWIEPPYTASTWVSGHWVERSGRHIWIEGHWEG